MKLFRRRNSTPEDEELAWQTEHSEFLDSLPIDIRNAAKHTTGNRKELENSKKAGCYYCLDIFEPTDIWEWIHSGESDEFPMCPYCGIDSVFGDASGYPVTKVFLREMNKYWFDGDGESVNKSMTKTYSQYSDKVLGVRNYEAEKDKFYAADFMNINTLYDFIWEVSEGESDFTPAGVAFLGEYFDFRNLAEQFTQNGRQLPPHGGGKSEKERIKYFVNYMNNIEPMEVSLFIAESHWEEGDKKDVKPSIDSLDERLLPPKEK